MKIKILGDKDKFLYPRKGTERSAAYDLYVQEDVVIKQGRNIVPTGFAIELDPNTAAEIRPRSGMASKGMEGYEIIMPTQRFLNESGDKLQFVDILKYKDREYSRYAMIGVKHRFDADVIIGLVDEDYRGETGIIINNRDSDFLIKRGTRIAQMLIINVPQTILEYVDELSETERKGGFGHTGA